MASPYRQRADLWRERESTVQRGWEQNTMSVVWKRAHSDYTYAPKNTWSYGKWG